ncbi:MAG TPA: hypothetical protein VLC46_00160 [Thermoanaerobaculia bacterium]|jgi:hypothetical protein|nr:hypothetical protein [Thermoanaerobaculia bacterium]
MATAIQKVLELQKQYEEAKQLAIRELLDQRKGIDDQLRALGHGASQPPQQKQRQTDPNKSCPICGEKGHDARRHKNDGKKGTPPKKP